MTKIQSKATVIVLIFTLMFGLTISNQTQANSNSFHYVALGDSLTVGLEPQQLLNPEAEVFGFVDRIYEQGLFYSKTTMKNYGVNGLTSTGLKNILVTMDKGIEANSSDFQSSLRDPRIDELLNNTAKLREDITRADLITITIGGNDFGARTYLDIRNLDEQQLQIFFMEKMAIYQKNLEETLTIIYKLNPYVTVVITDQYNPFPAINQEMYQKLTLLSTEFTNVLKGVSQAFTQNNYKLKVAPIAESFVNREILFTHILRGDIHPNQRGYDQMAKIISETLWGVYHAPESSNEPITIIVKGEKLNTPFPPVILSGRLFVPIREYTESLGAKVSWNRASQSAIVDLNNEVISFTVGENFITVGNEQINLNDQIQLINSKVYVPLRAIAEGLKFDVTYSKATMRAFIN